jgi:hypothetical protein
MVGVVAGLLSAAAFPGSVRSPQAATAEPLSDVIVILRDQLPSLPATHGSRAARAAALTAAQSAIVAQLATGGALNVRGSGLINAIAARVSPSQAQLMAAHPSVLAVVPDRLIRLSRNLRSGTLGGRATGLSAAAATRNMGAASVSTPSDGKSDELCNTLEPQALQLTHAAFVDRTLPQAQEVVDGAGAKVTGAGVRVAFIADGLDPTNAGFIRPDGSKVFIDYQDFSGDPAGTPTSGDEAFGDASSIAAQDLPNGKPLTFDISQFVNPALPLPTPCPIRIRGMAPGASLVGLKVFDSAGLAPESGIVQAIEWAVSHDEVDVINESFTGGAISGFYPDDVNDPVALANDAAVRAGVTVVGAAGDAGTAGTLLSPGTSPQVISAGASTQFRFYAQNNYGVQPLAKGYVNDNVSSFSSGGVSQSGRRTVDALAPGDLSWALCSTDVSVYQACYNDATAAGLPSPIEIFGGTSEASPLIAGEAALVIQAYRSTHRGMSPAPELVKEIVMSTSRDLSAPASEQGAGLVDALAAVQAALSIPDVNGSPAPVGEGIVISPGNASFQGLPGAHQRVEFKVSNIGRRHRHLTPVLETLGTPVAGAAVTLTLNPATDASFPTYYPGGINYYTEYQFDVPEGVQHLDAATAFANPLPGPPGQVFFGLIDPSGRQAAYSSPQGLSGYGHVDVVHPAGGPWTAIVFTPNGLPYTGPVQFTWSAENYIRAGSVSPASLDLAPGAVSTVRAAFDLPAQPGDSVAAVRFVDADPAADAGARDRSRQAALPITVRTLIPMQANGGDFAGTLTGGNGRAYVGGPVQTFAFDVPSGVNNMSLNLDIADNGYQLEGLLIDPNGMELSVAGNLDPAGDPQYSLQQFRANPQPGLWRFLLMQLSNLSGTQTAIPFTARIGFDTAQVSAPELPHDPAVKLSASGSPVTVAVTVFNTGAVTEDYFVDARLDQMAFTTLASLPCSSTTTLPGACGTFMLPTQVTHAEFVARSNAPITMDAFNISGYSSNYGTSGLANSPDVSAKSIGRDTEAASLSEPEVPFGQWLVEPELKGPFGAAGATAAPLTTSATLWMPPFDPAVSADSGDIWADFTLGTATYKPLTLAAGTAGVIHVTIKPDPASVGKTVSGYLYVDTFNAIVYTGDEVVRIPYRYTVVP